MSKKETEKHSKIAELALSGKTAKEIGLKFGITKQRVGQILNFYKIDPRTARRENRLKLFNILADKIKSDLNSGMLVDKIRTKYELKPSDILALFKKGIDIRLIKKDEILKRDKKCLKLYKSGLTGHEITEKMSEYPNVTRVYSSVCKLNNGHLPKRENTRQRRAIKFNKKLAKLKKKNTFTETHNLLVSKGVKNLNGGELTLGTIIQSYYRWQKK